MPNQKTTATRAAGSASGIQIHQSPSAKRCQPREGARDGQRDVEAGRKRRSRRRLEMGRTDRLLDLLLGHVVGFAAARRSPTPRLDDEAGERLVDRLERLRPSTTPEAAAFSSSCSGREAPTIAEATFGSRSTQASASWASESPASAATGRSRSTASKTSSSRKRPIAHPIDSETARDPRRRRLAAAVLPGQHTLAERRPHDLRDALRERRAG